MLNKLTAFPLLARAQPAVALDQVPDFTARAHDIALRVRNKVAHIENALVRLVELRLFFGEVELEPVALALGAR